MSKDNTSEATSSVGTPPADSLDAAASAFQGLLFPQGAKKKPGEISPKSEDLPADDDAETALEGDEADEAEGAEDDAESETEEPDETTEADEAEGDESESEGEASEESESEDTEPTVRSRKLKLPDGTEQEVSEDEAYQGYLRTKDYTQKTQRAAEAFKKAQAAEQAASEKAREHLEQLEKVKLAMDRLVPKEPVWAELRKTLTPEAFADTLADWQAFKKQRDEVEAEQTRIAAEQTADFQKKYETWRKSEVDQLLASVPEWVDQDVGKREAGEMAQYAVSIGFSQEEVDQAVDHRVLLMLRKAMLWDKAQTVGAGKVKPKVTPKGKIKSAPPGGKKTPLAPKSEEARARESLRKSGDMKSAESVFSHMLRRGPKGA